MKTKKRFLFSVGRRLLVDPRAAIIEKRNLEKSGKECLESNVINI